MPLFGQKRDEIVYDICAYCSGKQRAKSFEPDDQDEYAVDLLPLLMHLITFDYFLSASVYFQSVLFSLFLCRVMFQMNEYMLLAKHISPG